MVFSQKEKAQMVKCGRGGGWWWGSLAHPCEFQLEMDFSIFPAQEVFAPHQLWEMGGRIHTNPGK